MTFAFHEYKQTKSKIIAEGNKLFQSLYSFDQLNDLTSALEYDFKSPIPPIRSIYSNWIDELDALVLEINSAQSHSKPEFDSHTDYSFVHFWRQPINHYVNNFRHRVNQSKPNLVSDLAWDKIYHSLLKDICSITEPVFWASFNSLRPLGVMLDAYLEAEALGPDQSFKSKYYQEFIASLNSDLFVQLLSKYPLLGLKISVCVSQWKYNVYQLLYRLVHDWGELQLNFLLQDVPHIVDIQLGCSDPHNHGQTVSILTFSARAANSQLNMVYKPKSLVLDVLYNDIIELINKLSGSFCIATYALVDKTKYGYTEFIVQNDCASEDQFELFYSNIGRVMACVYLLGCTDCIYENFIAAGSQIYLIDAETLLEPERYSYDDFMNNDLETAVRESVLRTGMLPHWWWPPNLPEPIDISCIGVNVGLLNPQSKWSYPNSDAMKLNVSAFSFSLPKSLPFLADKPNLSSHYINSICRGLVEVLELVRLNRNEFVDQLTLFKNSSSSQRRIVLRRTQQYFDILKQLLEPSALESVQAHNQVIRQNLELTGESTYITALNTVSDLEAGQLALLDIPYIEHNIGESFSSSSHNSFIEAINSIIRVPGVDAAINRVKALNDDDISFQERMTLGAISSRFPLVDPSVLSSRKRLRSIDQTVFKASTSHSPFFSASLQCADELLDISILSRSGDLGWMSLGDTSDNTSFNLKNYSLVGDSFFSGSLGISLFLLMLSLDLLEVGDTNKSNHYFDSFVASIQPLERKFLSLSKQQFREWWHSLPLGLVGSGGILLGLWLISNLCMKRDKRLSTSLQLIVENLTDTFPVDLIHSDTLLDLNSGLSGLVGVLSLQNTSKSRDLLFHCGERLLDSQSHCGGWQVRTMERPLTGLSHGAAGISAALSSIYRHIHDERFLNSIRQAIEFETASYDSSSKNWKDFRFSDSGLPCMTSLCHGAPGIALSRLIIQSNLNHLVTVNDLDSALNTTLDFQPRFDTLCCGGLGISAILSTFLMSTDDDRCRSKVNSLKVNSLLTSSYHDGYRYPNEIQGLSKIPGLFTGLAGVGMGFLESNLSHQVLTSVLTAGLYHFS